MAIARFDPPNGGGDLPEYRPIAEINITPLVDVMLVVLVVFMVAAPLMVAGVRVDLPHTATTRLSETKKPMVVTLARDGSVYVRDQKTDLADLADRLAALRRQEGDTTVYLRADRGIVYGDVMELLGRITAVGYERVSLLAQPPRRSDGARIR